MNDFDDKIIDRKSWSFLNLIGQTLLGFPLGVGTIYFVNGAPVNAMGNNGDYALRQDAAAGTHLYFRTAGAWVAVI